MGIIAIKVVVKMVAELCKGKFKWSKPGYRGYLTHIDTRQKTLESGVKRKYCTREAMKSFSLVALIGI